MKAKFNLLSLDRQQQQQIKRMPYPLGHLILKIQSHHWTDHIRYQPHMKRVINVHHSPFTHFKIPKHKMIHRNRQQLLHVDRHFQLLVSLVCYTSILHMGFRMQSINQSITNHKYFFFMIFQRCSSLERPLSSSTSNARAIQNSRQCPSPLPAHMAKGIYSS